MSNLMAAHMISIARREYDADWRLTTRSGEPESQHDPGSSRLPLPQPLVGDAVEPTRVRYSYYTAGSGGVGPTILETSFLLAGTDVVVYRNGEKVTRSCAKLPALKSLRSDLVEAAAVGVMRHDKAVVQSLNRCTVMFVSSCS